MLTPARRVASLLGAVAAVASGACILFWVAGFLSFFVIEWFSTGHGTGGVGAVSFGFAESAALLLLGVPLSVLLNRRLRAWAQFARGWSRTLHRLHSVALGAFFVLLAIAVALILVGGDDVALFTVAGIFLPVLVLYGLQFLLLGALLGLYAATPDPDAAQP